MKPFRILALLLALGFCFSLSHAQDEAPAEADDASDSAEEGSSEGDNSAEAGARRALNQNYITSDLKKAVKDGLKKLSELQDDHGGFTRAGGHNVAIAITSLAGMAFVANGSTPDRGPYSKVVRKTMEYLLAKQDPNSGYFTSNTDGSRIHGHCYATQFLTQVYGTMRNKAENAKVEKAVIDAVRLIERGQTQWGGWGYIPDDLTWDEGSTTVCAIQALRAASDAGINVKLKTIQNAVMYMQEIAEVKPIVHDGVEMKGYTFMYSKSSRWNSDSYALCAAAVTTLNGIGIYAEGATWKEADIGRIYKGGLDWLRYKFDDFITRRKKGQGSLDVSHFYYAHFYAAQAMWMAPKSVFFAEYYPKIRDILIEEQKRNPANNGAWPSQSYGEAYTTAYALLVLQVPYQLLPMYAK
ncbi:MAG: prenyltransferase/squalene oxidase repeat-containing protein [Planctomycetota bacterium]|jgi:hypothetical protein